MGCFGTSWIVEPQTVEVVATALWKNSASPINSELFCPAPVAEADLELNMLCDCVTEADSSPFS